MLSTNQQSTALMAAIGTVRATMNQAPVSILASMYREVAKTTHDCAKAPDIKKHWSDIIEILAISNDEEIAVEFKSWVEKTIKVADPRTVKDFLTNVLNGIITTGKRS